jgi:hypothetical protein
MKIKKKDPEKESKARQEKAAKNYAKNINPDLKPEDVRAKYLENAYGKGDVRGMDGKPAMQKIRRKGSTTKTAFGEPVKKYEKGTKSVVIKKKKC